MASLATNQPSQVQNSPWVWTSQVVHSGDWMNVWEPKLHHHSSFCKLNAAEAIGGVVGMGRVDDESNRSVGQEGIGGAINRMCQHTWLLKVLSSIIHPTGRLHFHVSWEAQRAAQTITRAFNTVCNQAGRCLESILVILCVTQASWDCGFTPHRACQHWGQRSPVSPCINFQETSWLAFCPLNRWRKGSQPLTFSQRKIMGKDFSFVKPHKTVRKWSMRRSCFNFSRN